MDNANKQSSYEFDRCVFKTPSASAPATDPILNVIKLGAQGDLPQVTQVMFRMTDCVVVQSHDQWPVRVVHNDDGVVVIDIRDALIAPFGMPPYDPLKIEKRSEVDMEPTGAAFSMSKVTFSSGTIDNTQTTTSKMTDEQLFDALDGLFAYDMGAVSSGIHDELLRERVKAEIVNDAGENAVTGPRLTRFARRYLEAPYTLEDVAGFVKWLRERMDFEI